MKTIPQFAEYVSPGHPDRLADGVAEYLVGSAVANLDTSLCAIEVAVHESSVTITGRIAARNTFFDLTGGSICLRPETIAGIRGVYQSAGYGRKWGRGSDAGLWEPAPARLDITSLLCLDELGSEEIDVRPYSDDQNVIIGYACNCATTNYLPPTHYLALTLGRRLREVLQADYTTAFGPDFKILCTCRAAHGGSGVRFEWERLTFSVQHCDGFGIESQHRILTPIIGEILRTLEGEGLDNVCCGFDPRRHLVLNGAGDFVVGGTHGDNGLSGKKLVVDHYGPSIPIGGGALCGKDPYKIDRCGALRARQLAKKLVRDTGAPEAKVTLSWSPGEDAPGLRFAELVDNEQTRVVDASGMPDADWFSIRTIVEDLKLVQQDWLGVMRTGYFAKRSHPWEA